MFTFIRGTSLMYRNRQLLLFGFIFLITSISLRAQVQEGSYVFAGHGPTVTTPIANYTPDAGTNRLLVAIVSFETRDGVAPIPANPSYGGVPMRLGIDSEFTTGPSQSSM